MACSEVSLSLWLIKYVGGRKNTDCKQFAVLTVGNIVLTVGNIVLTVGNIVLTVGNIVLTVGNIVLTVGNIVLTVGNIMAKFLDAHPL
jgi:ABC-type uncharacterized transport system permease subunit